MFFFFTWHVCHSGMPFIFKTAMPNLHVFFPFTWHVCDCDTPFIFKITMPNLHVFFLYMACMHVHYMECFFFAKPVGYNFSVAILLPCTEHMGIPNIHEPHEHIFHA